MHLRDIPHSSLLQRLQTLCHAHQVCSSKSIRLFKNELITISLYSFKEFTTLHRRFDSTSPLVEHPCPRYDDHLPPPSHCRPMSSSPGIIRRYEDSGLDDHFEEEFEFSKKYWYSRQIYRIEFIVRTQVKTIKLIKFAIVVIIIDGFHCLNLQDFIFFNSIITIEFLDFFSFSNNHFFHR